jgi:hypothetical protein
VSRRGNSGQTRGYKDVAEMHYEKIVCNYGACENQKIYILGKGNCLIYYTLVLVCPRKFAAYRLSLLLATERLVASIRVYFTTQPLSYSYKSHHPGSQQSTQHLYGRRVVRAISTAHAAY